MLAPQVVHLKTLPLKHNGDCCLLGVSADLMIYVEEFYGEDGWLAQHALTLDGTLAQSVDEALGAVTDVQPLALPPGITRPKTGWHTMALNFAGPRHRGMRGPERASDLVRSLPLDEKMLLAERLGILPPLLLGMAESYVLAETMITRPSLYFVCRRVRIAYALPEQRLDSENQPYDYDTEVLYLAHFYKRDTEPSFGDVLGELCDVPLHRPMDCLLSGNHLLIADGGADERLSAIHVWHIDLPAGPTEEEKLHGKIYG